ncbi:uncharacterized protein BDV14DRAFT_168252 [Aspergillus stella-maris]|uniref:uncharacterized protein n=1 Tax=Aspergillus stella-maris TaxID=1810926 RepID=UPI003CCCCCE5
MAGDFQFVSIQATGKDGTTKDRALRRQARSHAVKKALEKKRRRQQLSGNNFAITTISHLYTDEDTSVVEAPHSLPIPCQILGSALDPFQTLAMDSSRLQVLLGDHRARQAPEPVFSLADALAFQSFHSVFRSGFDDPALANAVMLTLAFAVNGDCNKKPRGGIKTTLGLDSECLRYQGQAITYIRERMDCVDSAASEATIGAILLVVGVVACLGLKDQVELHMGAVNQLLNICRERSVYLTPGIKRAIFWQDLNASILSGSTRIVTHTTFSELLWVRDPFVPDFHRLPVGLESLNPDERFREILEDLHALKCIRDIPKPPEMRANVLLMLSVNNHTGSLQSRLVELGLTSQLSPLQECVRLAAYLCSVMLCCKVWCGLVVPAHISTQLLTQLRTILQQDTLTLTGSEDPDPALVTWLLYIGGAFAPPGPVRSGYLRMIQMRSSTADHCSWSDLHKVLEQFIWAEEAFLRPVRAFWMEVSEKTSKTV